MESHATLIDEIQRLRESNRELAETLTWALQRMGAEVEWLDKAEYPARFMVEREEQLIAARAALAKVPK